LEIRIRKAQSYQRFGFEPRQESDESILENRGVYDKAPAEPTSEDRVTA